MAGKNSGLFTPGGSSVGVFSEVNTDAYGVPTNGCGGITVLMSSLAASTVTHLRFVKCL